MIVAKDKTQLAEYMLAEQHLKGKTTKPYGLYVAAPCGVELLCTNPTSLPSKDYKCPCGKHILIHYTNDDSTNVEETNTWTV